MDLRIIFMGSAKFSIPCLISVFKSFQLVGVVTQPDRPAGRGKKIMPSGVKWFAESNKIPIIQPKSLKEPDAIKQLVEWKPHLIVVAAFGQILRKEVLEIPEFGCINVHASLLPKWRGASPIQAAILNGDTITGITLMKMDPGLDTGPIIWQQAIPISNDDTAGSLSERLANLGAELLIQVIPEYVKGNIKPVPQDNSISSYAPLIKKEDGELNFYEEAYAIERKIRAYSPWPCAFMHFENQVLKIHAAHVVEFIKENDQASLLPGTRLIIQKFPAIITAKDILVLDKVQLPGKRIIGGNEFLNGIKNWNQEINQLN